MKWRVSIYRRMSYLLALGLLVELFFAEPVIKDIYYKRVSIGNFGLLLIGTTVLFLVIYLHMTNYPGKYYNYVIINDDYICSYKIGKRKKACVDLRKTVYFTSLIWKTRTDKIELLVISNQSFAVPSKPSLNNVYFSDHFDESNQVLLYMNKKAKMIFPKSNWVNIHSVNNQDLYF